MPVPLLGDVHHCESLAVRTGTPQGSLILPSGDVGCVGGSFCIAFRETHMTKEHGHKVCDSRLLAEDGSQWCCCGCFPHHGCELVEKTTTGKMADTILEGNPLGARLHAEKHPAEPHANAPQGWEEQLWSMRFLHNLRYDQAERIEKLIRTAVREARLQGFDEAMNMVAERFQATPDINRTFEEVLGGVDFEKRRELEGEGK